MPEEILVVDDDPAFLKILSKVLQAHGYAVAAAASGKAGLELARERRTDLVILDLAMPGIKGLDVCQQLKQDPVTAGIPILILTGNDAEGQDVSCLDMGADGYLTKPIKSERILAHCRALLRRAQGPAKNEARELALSSLRLDYARKTLFLDGREYPHLTPKEFELLYELARRSPLPLDKETLYREVWGTLPPSEGSLKTVEVHVRRIRLKLGLKSDRWLLSIPGRGYCLAPPLGPS